MPDTQNPRAFPSVAIDDRFGGMDLLSYFAGQALAGICAHDDTWGLPSDEKVAVAAFDAAEAMLAQRAKRIGPPQPPALVSAAELLFHAGHLATADFHRIVNRIRAAENVREGAGK